MCVSGCVYLLAFKLCQFWLTPVRQLVADAFVPQRQREREKKSAVKFADCTSKNTIHKTIHARALIKKCTHRHTNTHTSNGACKHATISFILRFFDFYFNLCFVSGFFFRFLAWKVSWISHALLQLFKIPLDTTHTHTVRHRHTQRELREQRQNEASVLPADVVLKSVCHCSSLKNQLRVRLCVFVWIAFHMVTAARRRRMRLSVDTVWKTFAFGFSIAQALKTTLLPNNIWFHPYSGLQLCTQLCQVIPL